VYLTALNERVIASGQQQTHTTEHTTATETKKSTTTKTEAQTELKTKTKASGQQQTHTTEHTTTTEAQTKSTTKTKASKTKKDEEVPRDVLCRARVSMAALHVKLALANDDNGGGGGGGGHGGGGVDDAVAEAMEAVNFVLMKADSVTPDVVAAAYLWRGNLRLLRGEFRVLCFDLFTLFVSICCK
jgi:hypothetical protein